MSIDASDCSEHDTPGRIYKEKERLRHQLSQKNDFYFFSYRPCPLTLPLYSSFLCATSEILKGIIKNYKTKPYLYRELYEISRNSFPIFNNPPIG